MSDYVFPQFNDYDDPQNFAFHLGQSNLGDFVEYGLSLTEDHAAETFDLSEGKAYVKQTDAVGDASGETRHRLVYGVHVDAISDIGFATTSGVNYVWLDANVESQDSPDIVVETNDTAPSDASIKIGEIDAANDTAAVETNREPPGAFRSLDVVGDVTVNGNDVDLGGGRVMQAGDVFLQDGARLHTINAAGATAEVYDDYRSLVLQRWNEGGPVEFPNTDVKIGAQDIVDDANNVRFRISSGATQVRAPGNRVVQWFNGGQYNRYYAHGNEPWQVWDSEGSFLGIEYQTSASSPGTLDLANADVQNLTVEGEGSNFHWSQDPNSPWKWDSGGDSYMFTLGNYVNKNGEQARFRIMWGPRPVSPNLDLAFNNDTTNGNYVWWDESGTKTTGANTIPIISTNENYARGWIEIELGRGSASVGGYLSMTGRIDRMNQQAFRFQWNGDNSVSDVNLILDTSVASGDFDALISAFNREHRYVVEN